MEFFFFVLFVWVVVKWRRRRRRRQSLSSMQDYQTPVSSGVPYVQAPASAGGGGWYPDPTARYALRYWNGSTWTEHVTSGDGSVRADHLITPFLLPGIQSPQSAQSQPGTTFVAPDPATQTDGPDLNDLRRRFNS